MILRRNKSFKSFLIFFILFLGIFFVPIFMNIIKPSINFQDDLNHNENTKKVIIKTSDYWVLSNITINDLDPVYNWTWAKDQPWCSGNGTQDDPYIIENVTIDGSGFPPGIPCIRIDNSTSYFIIKNCTLLNSPQGCGILLRNVSNGQIIDNNCSFNFAGIGLLETHNVNISHTILLDNGYIGIGLFNCNKTRIIKNQEQGSSFGIYLSASINNTVYNNSIKNNEFGLSILDIGMSFPKTSVLNNITQNIISYNSEVGINITDLCNDNRLYNNTLIGNTINAVDNNGSNFWNSSEIGNYWDDYDGFDLNEDGVGETPYEIYSSSGVLTNCDYLPIWDIPDDIDPIITPKTSNNIFGKSAPVIEFIIDEYDLNETWYTINDGETKYYFTGTTITIDQELWSSLPDGTHIIRIYARDTSNNIGIYELSIVKIAFFSDLLFIIIISIIILLMVSIGAISIYQYYLHPRSLDKKGAKNIMKKWNSENQVPQKFEISMESNDTTLLRNIDFTLISEDFLAKIDRLKLTNKEKEEFLKEMLSMTPEMRNELIDDMLDKE